MHRIQSANLLSSNDHKPFQISAMIVKTETICPKKMFMNPFTNYIIQVSTSYKTWNISKRYSQFESLNKSLTRKVIHLPKFPPKRVFKTKIDIVDERITMFNSYLAYIIKKLNVVKFPEIIRFLEVPGDVIDIYLQNSGMFNPHPIITRPPSDESINSAPKENYFSAFVDFKSKTLSNPGSTTYLYTPTVEQYVIEEFLRNLTEQQSEQSTVVNTFISFIKEGGKWKKFTQDEIITLLIGTNEAGQKSKFGSQSTFSANEFEETKYGSMLSTSTPTPGPSQAPLQGLLYHIGNFEKNYLGALKCLELLNKLIDYEFNPECELYIHLLKTRSVDTLLEMKLMDWIHKINNGKKFLCYKILNVFINDIDSIAKVIFKFGGDFEDVEQFTDWYTQYNNLN